MRMLVHLSDLHMGRLHADVLPPLAETVRRITPDLVIVSGDFTQRARRTEFLQARAFLDSLGLPTFSIPGNHDVPFWNVAARFLTPLARYQRYITSDLEPVYEDDEIIVVGVNTARSLAVGGGRINEAQVEQLLARLRSAPRGKTRIVVTHHPFDLPPGVKERRLLRRAPMAMARLAEAGADLFLSGHLHLSHVSHSAERYRIAGHSALIVQAGTVSMRGRGEEPSFNVLRLDAGRLTLDRQVWDPAQRRFVETAFGVYDRGRDGWTKVTEAHD